MPNANPLRHHFWITPILFCLCLFFLPSIASAQDSDALDRDLEEQWTTRDLSARTGSQLYTTAHRFELAVNLGYLATDEYYNYVPIVFDVHYKFTENWGLMLKSSILSIHTDTALSEFMSKHQSAIDVKYLGDEQIVDFSLTATFHPVYGKWTVETTNLGYFDWGIFAGIGVVVAKTPDKLRTTRDTAAHAEGVFGTDFHFFFLDWLALKLEASLRFYHTPNQWLVPCTFTAGVSFFLPEIEY